MTAAPSHQPATPEVERQLAAAAERHREVSASMREPGRPEAGQHVAVKSVGRAVHLVAFALKRAAGAGVPFKRLVELTGWEPDLVREGLEMSAPEPRFVARLMPTGPDARAVAQAAAAFEANSRLHDLTQKVLADIDQATDAHPAVDASQLDDLYNRMDAAWQSWRHDREREQAST
jgi:hypothetical protein